IPRRTSGTCNRRLAFSSGSILPDDAPVSRRSRDAIYSLPVRTKKEIAMSRDIWMRFALLAITLGVAGSARAQAPAAESAVRPPLLFREEWAQPPFTGKLNDENRRVTEAAVTN